MSQGKLNPIPALQALVDSAVKVADLEVDPLFLVPTSVPRVDLKARMEARGFDVAGLDSKGTGRADGFVTLADLNRDVPLWKLHRPILASEAAEKSMTLGMLLRLLRDREFIFILDEDHVQHVVTRADIARPAVNLVSLSYLLSLERGLVQLASLHLGPGWFRKLPEDRQKKAEELYGKKRDHNAEMGLEECLYFDDAMTLALAEPTMVSELGTTTGTFNTQKQNLNRIRNDVAHGGTLLDALSPQEALESFEFLRRITERAWELLESIDPGEAFSSLVPVQHDERAEGWAITAWNPDGLTRPDRENWLSQRRMVQQLDADNIRFTRIELRNGKTGYAIPAAILVDADARQTKQLAADYGQGHCFLVEGESVTAIRANVRP